MEDYPTPRALRKDEIPGIIDAFRFGCHPSQCTWVGPVMRSAAATVVGFTCLRATADTAAPCGTPACRKGARNAQQAGFDGVEVHGANGGCGLARAALLRA